MSDPVLSARVPPALSPDFHDWLNRRRQDVDGALSDYLKEIESSIGTHSRLAEAVQYSVRVGGKRLRPILVLESCQVCGGRCQEALPAALAIELVHTFSLIHDDLPAMDNDDTRRGQPTSHKVFGEATAILAGDWLVTHAFALLASDRVPRAVVAELVQALAHGTECMIAGQGADIEGERRAADGELVRYIHGHKTAALIETCCRMGALCARVSGEMVSALAKFGYHLGMAFQITDDLLDATGAGEIVGKAVGKDACASKQTWPAAFGVDASRRRAEEEIQLALHKLDSFGGRADRLRDLARFVLSRDR